MYVQVLNIENKYMDLYLLAKLCILIFKCKTSEIWVNVNGHKAMKVASYEEGKLSNSRYISWLAKFAVLDFSSSLAFLCHAVPIKIIIQFVLSCVYSLCGNNQFNIIKPRSLVAGYLKHITQLQLWGRNNSIQALLELNGTAVCILDASIAGLFMSYISS